MDAEVMIAALLERGWVRTQDPASASTIIINSCGFIEPAKQESIDVTLATVSQYPEARVILAGCLSQRYPEELASEIPELAAVFGNRAPEQIADLVEQTDANPPGTPVVLVPEPTVERPLRPELLSFPGSAYVKVSEGCDNRCSFCAIPLIRGRMRSRPPSLVLTEIDDLLARGVREINLVAQDLASYGRDLRHAARRAEHDTPGSAGFSQSQLEDAPAELLRAISERDGDFWVRLLYVYPDRFPESFLSICAEDPRILPYFDIPLQHANREVLRRMGRPGTGPDYLELIRRIRTALPGAVIRSTFLVGFFGETDEAFSELLDFQQEAELDWLGVFPYSPEEGTPAMTPRGDGMPEPEVPPEVAEERAAILRERQIAITHSRMDRFVGTVMDVLVEENVPDEPLAIGRCYAQAPEVDGAVVINTQTPLEPGTFVRCAIARRNGLDLEGVPL